MAAPARGTNPSFVLDEEEAAAEVTRKVNLNFLTGLYNGRGVRVLLRKGEELGVLVVCYRTACINNPDDLITRGGGALLSD